MAVHAPLTWAGMAIHRAAEIIIAKGKPLAAQALEAAEADIVFTDGAFRVAGTDRLITLLDTAALAREQTDPLDTFTINGPARR